jgi:hypothetical protein
VDASDVKLVLEAKKQLQMKRFVSIATILIAPSAWLVSSLFPRYHDLAQSAGWAVSFGGFLANSDIFASASVITRKRLIEAVEAQINRDTSALQHLSKLRSSSSI